MIDLEKTTVDFGGPTGAGDYEISGHGDGFAASEEEVLYLAELIADKFGLNLVKKSELFLCDRCDGIVLMTCQECGETYKTTPEAVAQEEIEKLRKSIDAVLPELKSMVDPDGTPDDPMEMLEKVQRIYSQLKDPQIPPVYGNPCDSCMFHSLSEAGEGENNWRKK